MFLLQPLRKKKMLPTNKQTSNRSVEYFLRIDIISILSYAPATLFPLMITCRRLHSYLKHHSYLWLLLLAHLREDCAICWHESQDFCHLVGSSHRDELKTRIAHICARREWRVRFSSRVFTLPSPLTLTPPSSTVLSPVILPQKESTSPMKRVCRKSNQVAPIQSVQPIPLQSTESSMVALLNTFLALEFPSLLIGGKRDCKHYHSKFEGTHDTLLNTIKMSGWTREQIMDKKSIATKTLEGKVVHNLSVAVGGNGGPSGVFWHSIVVRSFSNMTHYTQAAFGNMFDDDEDATYVSMLVAVKLHRCVNPKKGRGGMNREEGGQASSICARVAGAVIIPNSEYGTDWIDRVADYDVESDDDFPNEG